LVSATSTIGLQEPEIHTGKYHWDIHTGKYPLGYSDCWNTFFYLAEVEEEGLGGECVIEGGIIELGTYVWSKGGRAGVHGVWESMRCRESTEYRECPR
jgi:hypothetical protein